GVSRSAMQRAPAFVLDLAAELIAQAHCDPRFEDPSNLLLALHKAGLLQGHREGMSMDQALLIDAAETMRDEHRSAELLHVYGERIGADLPVSSAFLLGAARLANRARELSEGEHRAVSEARAMLGQKEVEIVSQMLDLSEREVDVAREIVFFLKHRA